MESLPTMRPTGHPAGPSRHRGIAASLIAAVTATVVAGLVTSCDRHTVGTATTQHSASAPATGPASPSSGPAIAGATPSSKPPVSDEDQARQGILDFQNAYNSQNWDAYTELMCSAMRTQFTGVVMDSVKRGRAQNGPVVIKSVTVSISGDDAIATINGASEGLGPGTITMPMKREDGWKVCQLR